ncbi:MAG: tRNA pseudouridine(55) synthase TruB [Firmicutes bacterium]|nr:tRNA pseudouridine(55) synthase TruB [Bacillota bacterium]
MDGFINFLKPAGMTSHDAVTAMRRILRMKKIGHTGTLDPMACGVLSVCVGSATRAAEYLESDSKAYRCELILGRITDTGDIWGETVGGDPEAAEKITEEQVREVLASMVGPQDQYPPKYSAIRINGRRLYEYARNGEEVEIEPRRIEVYELNPLHIFEEPGRIMFDVSCSKGTYVRTICTDIGEKLGCGATMSFLVRTASGSFRLDESVTMEEMLAVITEAEGIPGEEILSVRHDEPLKADMSRFIRPADSMLTHFGSVTLDEAEHKKYVNGGKVAMRNAEITRQNSMEPGSRHSDVFLVYGPEGFAGTAKLNIENRVFTADKVFVR